MKDKKIRLVLAVFIVLLLISIIKSAECIGISANNLERDARQSQKIDDAWTLSKSENNKIAAMIFYNDTRDAFTFSTYLNHDGFSYGYFFAGGGTTDGIVDGTSKFTFGEKGSVLFSMNTKQVARIELDNGIEATTINIDSTKPFAEVIPYNCGEIELYDVNRNEVAMSDE